MSEYSDLQNRINDNNYGLKNVLEYELEYVELITIKL